jgi:hypothetical protein
VRFAPSTEDGIALMVFRGQDLDRAAAVLDQQGMLGDRSAEQGSIKPERVQTLHLDFTAVA